MISGEHVPSGRFNAGEKVWFWVGVVVLSLVVSASGLVLLSQFRSSTRGHDRSERGARGRGGRGDGHFSGPYLPSTIGLEGAYESMRNGYVDETWPRNTTSTGTTM